MKTLVIYKSKTGFTKKYAEWIGEELSCEVVDVNDSGKVSFKDFDLIIYGEFINAGKLSGIKKIKSLSEEGKCKLVVFATGASPAELHDYIEDMWRGNNIDDKTPHFYMQAGICYEKMDLFTRLIMKLFAKMMKKKKDKNQTETGKADALQNSFDISSREFIKPLVEYVGGNSL